MSVVTTQGTCEEPAGAPLSYSSPEMAKIYNSGLLYYGTERLSLADTAKRMGMSVAETEKYLGYYLKLEKVFDKRAKDANEIYLRFPELPDDVKEEEWNGTMFLPYNEPGKYEEILIPAWNDIIHLGGPPSYSSYELATIKNIWARYDVWGWSPPRIAEYEDMSLQKVLSYISKYRELQAYDKKKLEAALALQRSPSPEIAVNFGVIMTAIDDVQDFTTTVGVLSRTLGRVFKPAELLAIGSFTVGEFLNRLTMMNKLTGSEKGIVCKMVKEMKNSSRHSTIKTDVEKRMKRLFPSKGEIMEIAQTTDQLFGVGLSFGPLVGLAQDLLFGAMKGTPVRFKDWTISEREKAVLLNIWDRVQHPEKGFEAAFKDIAKWAESASNMVISGNYFEWNEFATGLVTSIYTGVQARCTGVKDAATSIWEIITGQGATAPKKTTTETRLLLQGMGFDPYGQDSWPVPGLGSTATILEIMDAYSTQGQKVLEYWRNKLGVSDEGLFLDACVKEIGLHASTMFTAEHGVITEGLDPSLLIYVHSVEAGLNPPSDVSVEKFSEWHDWVYSEMSFLDISVPPSEILKAAYQKFFSV